MSKIRKNQLEKCILVPHVHFNSSRIPTNDFLFRRVRVLRRRPVLACSPFSTYLRRRLRCKGSGHSVLTIIATDGTKNTFHEAANRVNFAQQSAQQVVSSVSKTHHVSTCYNVLNFFYEIKKLNSRENLFQNTPEPPDSDSLS